MTEANAPTLAKELPPAYNSSRSSVVYVCTSCRAPGSPHEPRESRAGFQLYRQLLTKLHASSLGQHVEVRPAECLSLCPRPCGIAVASPRAWCYLFGDQHPTKSADDILECVSFYIGTEDGFMPRKRRPERLRASVLGRVPPYERKADTNELAR